ncbi:hypothetical protein [Aliarcobacter butzleri]|uniref:hypothetical protein n=1 Tax=Aliarcobacter butzleri TaxID=28197 RepID=UPI001D02B81D|nr:hypothetical protein [Aliarcobacter butzleri]
MTPADCPNKSAGAILKIFHKIVEKKYIDKDIFNYFLKSETFRKYINKYLKLEQIDIINIDEYLVK